jgi:SWI/SNF-related matrix-associated actin-dependent regulator of chromatin subfamily A-like protein 1
MQLIKQEKKYVFECTFAEKDTAKDAGFRWDGVKRHWWTSDIDIAAKLAEHAGEELKAEFEQEAQTRTERLTASFSTDSEIHIPAPDGFDYFGYQRAGIASAVVRPSLLIADEMGLGKTIQAIGAMNVLKPAKVLVICPASLKINWANEIKTWLVIPENVYILTSKHTQSMGSADGIFIANYDILVKLSWLSSVKWDMVVADECHMAKNKKAQRSKAFYDLCKKAERRIFLTGTPILNRPVELHPIIEALGFPMKFWDYTKRYCDAKSNGYGWDMSGSSNLEELNEKLRATVMIRRLKNDVLKDLPAKIRQVIALPADDFSEQLKAESSAVKKQEQQRAMLRAALERSQGSSHSDAVDRLRNFEVASIQELTMLRKKTAVAKAPFVAQHVVEAIESGNSPVILFAHHKEVVKILADGLKKYRVEKITGETEISERQAIVERFQAGKLDVVIASIRAAGVGLTLTASSLVIFAEQDWTPGMMTQAEDRAHRIGQHNSVLIQVVVVDGSIDAKFAKTLLRKEKIAETALN